MPPSRTRSPSPEGPAKRQKLDEDVKANFHPSIFDSELVETQTKEYQGSAPFKHCRVNALFQDDLLENVKDECIRELAFTEKETDIYKVFQTGDLASLDFIDKEQLGRLPSILKLRDSLYSFEFRNYLRKVTGCGPLSGSKRDMSVNSYRKGCHLLNHDDVIDTRRVSYILYMPISGTKRGEHEWKADWGGALELYDVTEQDDIKEPKPHPAKVIPPSWNQFVFFEVQPGHSFHSVEEVLVGDEATDDGRQRLSISGWFHKPQEGEEGYGTEPEPVAKSSLQQLSSPPSTPFTSYPSEETIPPEIPLTPDEISFLSEYLNPSYLKPENLNKISGSFVETSQITLHDFLNEPLATKLRAGCSEQDKADEYSIEGPTHIPPHSSGLGTGWKVLGPPHKHRYCVLEEKVDSETESPYQAEATHITVIRALQKDLFPSTAFRAWLALVSRLCPRRHSIAARRFRPGLDYTLATSNDSEARLDVVLDLTSNSTQKEGEENRSGGWECYMAPDDGDEDPAVYRSRSSKKKSDSTMQAEKGAEDNPETEPNDELEDDLEQSEDATLLTRLASFNQLLIVLRDEGVLHFVKYVSAEARGSRWDISGEYEIDMVEMEMDDLEVNEGLDAGDPAIESAEAQI